MTCFLMQNPLMSYKDRVRDKQDETIGLVE